MGTLIELKAQARREPRVGQPAKSMECEVVIFPGVRIERHGIDLSHRVLASAGSDDFGGVGGGRPRKTS